jgi:1,4-dihydroxy-2-naphthoate octaprenyltransferase
MLLPFALLLPIGDRLPRGFVWPALIALPVALGMIYYFVREPRGRGFNRILVRTVFTQFLFGILLSLGLVL